MEDIHRQAFRDEAADLLAELETALLELEDAPQDSGLVNRIFRAMHTLKGSGAMFGFDDIAQFTHEVETVFDKVRDGLLPVTRPLLDLTFQAKDHVRLLFEHDGGDITAYIASGATILEGFRALAGEGEASGAEHGAPAAPAPAQEAERERMFRIRFKPRPGIYSTGNNPEYFLEDIKALGSAKVFAHFEDVPPLRELDPQSCHIWWDILLATTSSESAVRDVFMFVEDECDLSVTPVEAACEEKVPMLGEILVERGDISPEQIERAVAGQRRLGSILAESGVVPAKSVEAALAEQSIARDRQDARKSAPEAASSLRVSTDKLDRLQDLVGELVIVQAQIKQAAALLGNEAVVNLAEELERLSDDIRDSTLSIRMLPIGSTFSTYRRLVRDLCSSLGKEIDLVTTGEDTELDKTVLDRLADALIHLLRNSIDHGIELPAEREAAGKPRKGTIRLQAEHSGGDVVIEVIDDGKGIDPAKVRAKALERGLITEHTELSQQKTLELIFLPGFSTAEAVSNVSGRGVGMDVVKGVVESLRGNITLSSEQGRGSSVTVRLPLTLAIIDGLQVRVGDQGYVLPLELVEECVELDKQNLEVCTRKRIVNLRGQVVPYISLREWFCFPGPVPAIEQVVILGMNGQRVGLVVDHVVGEHQTVIKSLGPVFRKLDGFSGATIQGDGSMSLILDVKRIVNMALEQAGRESER
ncbi:chemotaxis protein CheA [Fundidesulfovibrio soli]|uniref:chemotaxis protein CheA n=1 Tax=Fundidesulfovibrio soli TaxID=2922716 RepID=UPI001FAFDBD4|nr:chemotaxis protein CheA [Fundidesulfovibrio soli]